MCFKLCLDVIQTLSVNFISIVSHDIVNSYTQGVCYSERAQPQVVRVEPQAGSVAFKKDTVDVQSPSRPSSLPMQTQNQSEPIPVPTQVKAYERIRSSSSPLSSPRKFGAAEVSPVDSAKVRIPRFFSFTLM